jgi:hypothetical protein
VACFAIDKQYMAARGNDRGVDREGLQQKKYQYQWTIQHEIPTAAKNIVKYSYRLQHILNNWRIKPAISYPLTSSYFINSPQA